MPIRLAASKAPEDIDLAQREHAARRQEALYLVNYKLTRLRHQLTSAGRLLNDLRILRRLLLNERALASLSGDTQPHEHAAAAASGRPDTLSARQAAHAAPSASVPAACA